MDTSGIGSDDGPQRLADPGELPTWVLEYTDAALRCGLKAPEIETRLVMKGVSPAMAALAVPKCLENRFQALERSRKRRARWRAINRVASLVVAAGYLFLASLAKGPEGFLRCLLFLLLPLACIWFSEAMGKHVGPYWIFGPYITRPTPAGFLVIGGWLVLLAGPLTIIGLILFEGPLRGPSTR
jgi:hypothetical protein